MKRALIFCLIGCVVASAAWAQKDKKQKPWTEWSRKDAMKILTDSPWARFQTVSDSSALFSGGGASGGGTGRRARVNVDQSVPLDFYICLLSAKPVRQAWAKRIELDQNPGEEFKAQLLKFVETPSDEWITISVTFNSPDEQIEAMVKQEFNRAGTERLREDTYLELKNGKRAVLQEYGSPERDLMGARFRFARTVDGQPFITRESGDIHFHARVTQTIVLNARFKASDLLYDGALEF